MIVAFPEADGTLCTMEFHETRADRGDVELFRGMQWGRKAPPGTGVLIPQSGQMLSKIDEFWWVWRDASLLYAQSVHSTLTVALVLEAGERLIGRPVLTANGELHIYSWRKGKLVRHRFAAGKVATETIWETDAPPLRSVCAPVPGGDGVVVAFVNETGEVLTASALLVRGSAVAKELNGVSEGRYRVMNRHRMALHAGVKSRPALALMAESRENEMYVQLELQFDFLKSECVWRRTAIEFVPAGSLQSVGMFYYKSQNTPEPFVMAVDGAGSLIWLRKRVVEVLRPGVGPDYGYPILTTTANRYEAVGSGRQITLQKF